MKIRCIIVDDEPLAQSILEQHISRFDYMELVQKCHHALQAFDVLHRQTIDLMFLDINMPSITGIDFLRSLKSPPKVIFTTAYSEYAVTGFELDAVDYLLKPITFERFEQSIQKLVRVSPPPAAEKNYTYFKVSGKLVKILHADLLYAQSVKDYIHLRTTHGNYLTHMTMKNLDELLPTDLFIRVHRSYLVNKMQVDVVDKGSLKVAGRMLPVGESYRLNLEGVFKGLERS